MTDAPTRSTRQFTHKGEDWIAWPSGGGAYGTGVFGTARTEAIHFARHAVPDVPVFEALLPSGRFWGLFDEELIDLFRVAVRVVDASAMPERPMRRRTRSLDERPAGGHQPGEG
jgi:hypothetical protein